MHKKINVNFVCFTAALAGLLFGFDTAVISGALGLVKSQYGLSTAMLGWFVSCGLLGCIIGVFASGALSDRIGRKKVLTVSGFMFLVSALGCALAPGIGVLIAGRMIGGIGVGMASVIAPMYISEFAPATARGRMVAYYQLAITAGILVAYLSNAALLLIAEKGNDTATSGWFSETMIWRSMFIVMVLPALLLIALVSKIPESPRWLISRDQHHKAQEVLESIREGNQGTEELKGIEAAQKRIKENPKFVLDKSLKMPLIIGIVLAVLQQFSGINAIIYYGPAIFESAGILGGNALVFQVIIGAINLMFTFVAIRTADKYGRRFLLIAGLIGIIISLVASGTLFYIGSTDGIVLLSFLLLFIACFALSIGPVTWIIINEIFPTSVRVKAVSVCTFFLWAAVWVVGQFFPWLLEKMGSAYTFWVFALFSLCNLIFSWKMVKETKNKSLEEAERMYVTVH
jgi:SP family arabinose:H+ symporter-like MFS transporter